MTFLFAEASLKLSRLFQFVAKCATLDVFQMNMSDVQLKFDNKDRGSFLIEENGEHLAEMTFGRNGSNLIVYHTEVSEKLKGQGVGLQLLERMVNFAREENLQVVPLCNYVHAQFKRHPERYEDIWNKHWHETK